MDIDAGNAQVSAFEPGSEVEDFANALDDCLNPRLRDAEQHERLLMLPQKLYENAAKRLSDALSGQEDAHMGDADDGPSSPERSTEQVEATARLVGEVQTWDLMRRLLPVQKSNSQLEQKSQPTGGLPAAESSSLKLAVNNFFQNDTLARERRAIIEWLQSSTTSRPAIDDLVSDLQEGSGREDSVAHGWLHTRSAIKLRKNVTSSSQRLPHTDPRVARTHVTKDNAPMVTNLDPDAATRQGHRLEMEDERFEKATWLGCFEHLRRASSMRTIRDWCQDRTEMWRAVSMSAALLSEDGEEEDARADPGTSAYLLWRRTCLQKARKGGSDEHERAVYGVLSGEFSSVDKMSQNWDDSLFANYNALLRSQLDAYLLTRVDADFASQVTELFPASDGPAHHIHHGDPERLDALLIRSLASSAEAEMQVKQLQGAVIAREASAYFERVGEKLGRAGGMQVDELRLMTHVYIILERLNRFEQPPQAAHNILADYIGYLRRAGLPELIPQYAAMLPPWMQYEVLRTNLITDTDQETRRTLLRLMKKANIDIGQYVRAQADACLKAVGERGTTQAGTQARPFTIKSAPSEAFPRGRAPETDKLRIVGEKGQLKPDFFGSDEEDIDLEHQHIVRALEWLSLVDETWPDMLAYGTQGYKYFLRNKHLGAARHLLENVTFADVVRAMGLSIEELDQDMLDGVEFWASQLEDHGINSITAGELAMNARSFRELEALVRLLDNLETMGSLIALSEEAPASNRDYWTKVGTEIRATTDAVKPLLSGWLLTGLAAGDQELASLRDMYITEVVLGYIAALHFAGTSLSRDYLLECLELSATIAEGDSDLARSFTQAGQMKELVEAFAGVSRSLAMKQGGGGGGGGSSRKAAKKGWDRNIWTIKS